MRWSLKNDTRWKLRAQQQFEQECMIYIEDCSEESMKPINGGYLHNNRFSGTQPTTCNTKTDRKASSWLKSQVGIPDLET